MGRPTLVAMGDTGRSFGVGGELRLRSHAEDPQIFARARLVWIGADPRTARPYQPAGLRELADGQLLLSLKEVDSKEAAAELQGRGVYLAMDELEPLGEDEYYWFQLKDARVLDPQGRELGRVKAVTDNGDHDLLVIEDPEGREALVPVVDEMILRLDLEAGEIEIDPPPGLLEAQGWEE